MSWAEAKYIIDNVNRAIKQSQAVGTPPGRSITRFSGNPYTKHVNAYLDIGSSLVYSGSSERMQYLSRAAGVRYVASTKPVTGPNDPNAYRIVDVPIRQSVLYEDKPIDLGNPDETNPEAKVYVKSFTYSDHGVFNNENLIDEADDSVRAGHMEFEYFWNEENKSPRSSKVYTGVSSSFKPMSSTYNEITKRFVVDNGTWGMTDFFNRIQPFYLQTPTNAVRVNPKNYSRTLDGDTIDRSKGLGYFVWIPRFYMDITTTTTDRTVRFDVASGTTESDYAAPGFYGKDNSLLEGIWMPMFYSDDTGRSLPNINANSSENKSVRDVYSAFIDKVGVDRAGVFGGPIINALTDLIYCLTKDTDINGHYGYGYTDPSITSISQISQNPDLSSHSNDNPAFCGSKESNHAVKFLHSLVLLSNMAWVRDPLVLIGSDQKTVSYASHYNLDINSIGSAFPDSFTASSLWEDLEVYPWRMDNTPGKFGMFPKFETGGNGGEGLTDGSHGRPGGGVFNILNRFGTKGLGAAPGLSYFNFVSSIGTTGNHELHDCLLTTPLPTPGYDPWK